MKPEQTLYGASFFKGISISLSGILLFDPRHEHSSAPTAHFPGRHAQWPSRKALLSAPPKAVLDGREHDGTVSTIGLRLDQ